MSTRLRPRRWCTWASAVGLAALAAGCLDRFASAVVMCDPAAQEPCPEQFVCIDPQHDGVTRCVQVGCGDGNVDGETEGCDDANDNEGDLCGARAPAASLPVCRSGESPDDNVACVSDPRACAEARFCAQPLVGLQQPGADVELGHPFLVAADLAGNVYVSSVGTNVVSRLDAATRQVTRFAGNGSSVSLVDGSRVRAPQAVGTALLTSIAADGLGNVYFAEARTNSIVVVDAVTGQVATVAGTGAAMPSADGAFAATSPVNRPVAVAVDGAGTLYFIETVDETDSFGVRRVRAADGQIQHLAISLETTHTVIPDPSERVLDLDFDDEGNLWLVAPGDAGFLKIRHATLAALPEGATTAAPLAAELLPFDACDRTLCNAEGTAHAREIVTANQARLAVAPDGSAVFFACGDALIRYATAVTGVDGADGAGATGRCVRIPLPTMDACGGASAGDVAVPGNSARFATGIADVALAPRRGGGFEVVVADPARGLVHRVTDAAVASRLADPAAAGESWSQGECFADGAALLADALFGFCAEADGRIALSATEACCALNGGCDAVTVDALGRYEIFVPIPAGNVVVRVDCTQSIDVVAGGAGAGFDTDEPRPAAGALLDQPVAASATFDGTVYIADANNRRVRRVFVPSEAVGTCGANQPCIDTLVPPCAAGDDPGGCVFRPGGLAVDASGALLITDAGPAPGEGRLVRVVLPSPSPVSLPPPVLDDIETGLLDPAAIVLVPYALLPPALAPPECATTTLSAKPCGIALYAERGAHRVRGLALAPQPFGLTAPLLLAGTPLGAAGAPGDDDDLDPGAGGEGRLRSPRGLMVDAPTFAADGSLAALNFLVVDAFERVRRISLSPDPVALVTSLPVLPTTLVTVRERGRPDEERLPSRDDASDGSGALREPADAVVLADGRVAIVDRVNGRLRVATPSTGPRPTAALVTVSGTVDGVDFPQCSAAATTAPVLANDAVPLREAAGLARVDDVLFVGERDARGQARIRRFHLSPLEAPAQWTTDVLCVAPDGPSGFAIGAIGGLDVDAETGTVFVADRLAHAILAITPTEGSAAPVRVVAGRPGKRGFFGDGEPTLTARRAVGVAATAAPTESDHVVDRDEACKLVGPPPAAALFFAPEGVRHVRREGQRWLYVADTGNNRVRRIALDEDGNATALGTVLGDGSFAVGGQGAPALSFPVAAPRGLDVDADGNLFVTSSSVIRFVAADTFVDPCGLARSARGLADGGDAVATLYGKERDGAPEAATRCLGSVAVDPRSPPGGTVVYAVDRCVGMLLRLDRTYGECAR